MEMSTPNEPVPTGDQVPKLLGTIITFDILAFTAVVLRFVSRRISHASLWWDDWFIIAALVSFQPDFNECTIQMHLVYVPSWYCGGCWR